MKRAIKTSVVIGAFACAWALAALPCPGATFTNTYISSADAWVDEENPDKNWGGDTATLRYTRAHVSETNEKAALVKFDVSDLPFDAAIQQATLSMFKYDWFLHTSDPDSNGTIQVDVAALLIPWNVLEVTAVSNKIGSAWNLPLARAISPTYVYDGAFDRGPVEGSVTAATNFAGSLVFDVTTSLADQVANDKVYGWILHGDMPDPGDNDGGIGMRDKAIDPDIWGHWPTLEVIFETGGTFPANLTIVASDDPNWTSNNFDDWRTATVEGGNSAEFRIALTRQTTPVSGPVVFVTNAYQHGINDYTNRVSDAYGRTLNSPAGDINHGAEAATQASNYLDPHGDSMGTFVAFADLGIPTNALVMKATLSLRTVDEVWAVTDEEAVPDGIVNLGVSALLKPFDEGSVTVNVAGTNIVGMVTNVTPWAQQMAQARADTYVFDGAFDRGPDESRAVLTVSNQHEWVDWNVTPGFQAQLSAGKSDYGFVIHSNPPAGADHDGRAVFRTWEYNSGTNFGPFGTYSPKFEVIWADSPTMPLRVERSTDGWATSTEVYSTEVPVGDATQNYRAVSID